MIFRSSFKKRTVTALVALAIVLGSAGLVAAQTAGAVPDSVTGTRRVNAPVQVMLTQGRGYLVEMKKSAATVAGRLRKAKEARDVVKKLCLDDKLTEINTAVTAAEGRVESLEAAARRNDAERASTHFSVLAVYKDRAGALLAESSQCVGEEFGVVGQTAVTFSVNPTIPDPDTGFTNPDTASTPPDTNGNTTPPVVVPPDAASDVGQ